jgi:alpha-glucoside transport system permease protein
MTTALSQHAEKGFFGRLIERWPAKLAVTIIAVMWTIPTLGLLISSFRTRDEIRGSGWWTAIPHLFDKAQWTISNYSTVLGQSGFGNAFLNSLAVTIPAVVIPITIAAFAAYAFAWMQFPGRHVLFALVVGLMVVPLQMALIPILRIYTNFDLVGTFPAVWLAHTGFGLPLAVYLLRNYIGSLPSSIIESAKIDGADDFTIFWRLIVPLSVPVLASFAIFQFLWVWNDFMVALIFLGPGANAPLTVAIKNNLLSQQGAGWNLVTAGGFFSMIVPILVFLFLQRYFVRGLTAGAVKG